MREVTHRPKDRVELRQLEVAQRQLASHRARVAAQPPHLFSAASTHRIIPPLFPLLDKPVRRVVRPREGT